MTLFSPNYLVKAQLLIPPHRGEGGGRVSAYEFEGNKHSVLNISAHSSLMWILTYLHSLSTTSPAKVLILRSM